MLCVGVGNSDIRSELETDEQIKLDREGPSVVGSKGPEKGHRLNLGLILEGCAYIRTHAEQQTIAIVHNKI